MMQKIPTLYVRDPENPKYVTEAVTPGCEWVLAGEGRPTRKWDGTCTMLDSDGCWWARREVKPGKDAPANFQAVSTDENTGKTVGWEPVEQSPFAKFHAEALDNEQHVPFTPGTYELCGPKINGNPERFDQHDLVAHGAYFLPDNWPPPLLLGECLDRGWEGVVWHHPDGRMAKLKVRDYPAPAHG